MIHCQPVTIDHSVIAKSMTAITNEQSLIATLLSDIVNENSLIGKLLSALICNKWFQPQNNVNVIRQSEINILTLSTTKSHLSDKPIESYYSFQM